ncbi:hypothetical protein FKM82_012348 [Ascaphus truei]
MDEKQSQSDKMVATLKRKYEEALKQMTVFQGGTGQRGRVCVCVCLLWAVTPPQANERWVQGINKKNVTFINNKTVCYPCGNFIVFMDIKTRKQSVLQCMTGRIGAFAANIYSEVVAFSDQKLKPSIYVYTFPGFVKRAELKDGAELDYSLIAFSHSGPYMASHTSVPDHVLTIWNWQEGISLCSQSESRTVFTNLTFNPVNWQQLCLSSEISVTVWNIEMCDKVYNLKAMPVKLPNEDGTMAAEEKSFNYQVTNQLSYYGPLMPTCAIAGLVGDIAETFTAKEQRRHGVQPNFHCWSATSDLYVGCKGGHLLAINSETQKVTVLTQTKLPSDGPSPKFGLNNGSIKTMAHHKHGLYVAGSDGVLHLCHIKGSEFNVEECWKVEEPIENISFSPNYKILSIATNKGSLYIYSHGHPGDTFNILNVYNEDLLSADFLTCGNKYCLTVGMSGVVQVWSLDDGASVGTLSLNIQATSMACCPSSHYAAVGSSTGHIYFIDVLKVDAPRIVQRTSLYRVPVQHLQFDQGGHVLLTGSADGHIFILDARPSSSFQVLGYTVVDGDIMSLSTWSSKDTKQIKAMALVCSTGEKKEEEGGTKLGMFSLTPHILSSPVQYVDERGMLKDGLIQKHHYEVEHPLFHAVMGSNANTVIGYCSYLPFMYKFVLPKEASGDLVTVLTAEKKVRGSQLGPGFLCLSPHHKWMAVSARDGILYIQDTVTMEGFAQVYCHSFQTGGIRSLAFSLDGQTIVTTGIGDGTLVCLKWKSTGKSRLNAAVEYGIALSVALEAPICKEDHTLKKMSLWTLEANSQVPHKQETEAVKKETQKYTNQKKSLKNGIKELRTTIQVMMRENELLPDIEKLDQQEFNLDTEEQQRLRAESEQEVARVRREIELENLAKQYLRKIIKQECWDAMTVKGRAVGAFHTGHAVKNYPLKEQTAKELEDFARVLKIKKIESADLKARKEIVEFQAKVGSEEEEEEEEEAVTPGDMASLIGSLSDQYGGDTSNLYSQLEIHTREEKINQIILLQDIIHNVKKGFNKDFEVVCRQKEQEVSRMKERNQRILEIMSELDLKERILEPKCTDDEKPERALTVEDSEIKVEKYLTPEQKAQAEELARQEEEKRLSAQEDNAKQRALNDMMGGVLEVKKEDILRVEIPRPAFLSRPETEWTEDERKQFKEYDKKYKELNEEKEKYRKILETEMKKIQSSVMETTQAFDDILTRLFEKKVKSEMVICQEELKINNLIFSILVDEEISTREAELNHFLEKKRKQKSQTAEVVQTFKTEVEAFRESYDNLVAEDKLLDRGFKKEFPDISAHYVDQLYKLYKRRPRVQRLRSLTEGGDRPRTARTCDDSIVLLMKAMDELDTPENMPEGLDLPVWKRFCLTRRSKMDYEQQVKRKALTLAEMQAFLQKRIEEDEKTRQDTENIMQELNVLREEKLKFQLDLTVQFLLKQGQVEVETTDLIPNFADAILLHRNVIEDLNGTIRGLGDQKMSSMVESKDFRKGIIQLEWEHKKLRMEMEDLNKKSRDITMLRVSKELQIYLNVSNYDNRVSNQISVLEETLNVQEKHHVKNVKNYKRIMQDLDRHINKKNQENTQLGKDLQEMLVTFSERKHIHDVVGVEQSSNKNARDRYMDIVHRRKLVDLVKAQHQEITVLRAEVERLRMKTFPALVQMDY